MAELSGLYQIDGTDFYDTFKMGVESGSDDFLKIPERKDSISHEWLDEDGTDIDLSRTFFKSRTINLKCFGIHDSLADFKLNYENLIAVFRKPGPRRLSIKRHNKDYFVYYKDNNVFDTFNTFQLKKSGKLAHKFTLTLVEFKPSVDYAPTFLTDESNRFIIT